MWADGLLLFTYVLIRWFCVTIVLVRLRTVKPDNQAAIDYICNVVIVFMVDRIRALLAQWQLTPTQFADLIQVGRPIVSHILSGRNKASLEVVQRIMAAFPEVALPWLLSGTGPMLVGAEAAAAITKGKEEPAAPPAPAGPPQPAPAIHPVAKAPRVAVPRATATNNRYETAVTSAFYSNSVAQGSKSTPPPQKFRINGQQSGASPVVAAPTEPASAPLPMSTQGAVADSNAAASPVHQQSGAAAQTQAGITEGQQGTAMPEDSSAGPMNRPPVQTSEGPSTPVSDPIASSPFLADKPIRRIVIFYRDGSFSDFQPEG